MVVLQIHKYYQWKDGASNHMLFISDLLEKAGVEVVPFSMQSDSNLDTPYKKFFVSAFDIQDPSKLSWKEKVSGALRIAYSWEAKRKIRELLKAKKIDVAHIHNIYNHITPSIFSELKKNGVKIVLTLHDYNLLSPNYTLFHHGVIHEEDAKGWYLSCIKNACIKDSTAASIVATGAHILQHKILKLYKKYVDVFIAPSVFMRDLCIRYGVPPEKIVCIPNPIDISSPFDAGSEDDGTVIYTGRLSEEKGLMTLLSCAEQTPHIPYKIVGTGPFEGTLKAYLQEKNIQNVEFVGFKKGLELQKIITKARLCVLPSLWYENCPLGILEPKLQGKIVLGSRIGGIPELLPDSLLFTPGDSLDLKNKIEYWYTTSQEERKNMGKTLRQQVLDQNNPELYLKKLLELYHSV